MNNIDREQFDTVKFCEYISSLQCYQDIVEVVSSELLPKMDWYERYIIIAELPFLFIRSYFPPEVRCAVVDWFSHYDVPYMVIKNRYIHIKRRNYLYILECLCQNADFEHTLCVAISPGSEVIFSTIGTTPIKDKNILSLPRLRGYLTENSDWNISLNILERGVSFYLKRYV